MPTYVLVHGAWHGGWMWGAVVQELRGVGHAVFAPTLTGSGERVHLANPAIGLELSRDGHHAQGNLYRAT